MSSVLFGLTPGCSDDTSEISHDDDPRAQVITPNPRPPTVQDAGGPVIVSTRADGGLDDGKLWCAVKQISDAKCAVCHDGQGTAGSPMGLVTFADYLKPSIFNPAKKVYEATLTRVHDTVRPMPPGRPLDAASLKIIDDWVAAGAPSGPNPSCTASDAGTVLIAPR